VFPVEMLAVPIWRIRKSRMRSGYTVGVALLSDESTQYLILMGG